MTQQAKRASSSFRGNLLAYLFILLFVAVLVGLAVTQPMSGGLLTKHHNSNTQKIGLVLPTRPLQ